MRLLQILLSQSEAGAETYFEKIAAYFAGDKTITQRLIIKQQLLCKKRLQSAVVDYRTLPMGTIGTALFYGYILKKNIGCCSMMESLMTLRTMMKNCTRVDRQLDCY